MSLPSFNRKRRPVFRGKLRTPGDRWSQHLHLPDDGRHHRLASLVQFAHDIIQQHHRRFLPALAVDLRLRQFQ